MVNRLRKKQVLPEKEVGGTNGKMRALQETGRTQKSFEGLVKLVYWHQLIVLKTYIFHYYKKIG